MLTSNEHGWVPSSQNLGLREMFGEAVAAAERDPLFGLPEWVRGEDPDELRTRPLVLMGVNEFTHGLLACLPEGKAIALVDDHQRGLRVGGVECISSPDYEERYRGGRSVLSVDCARYGAATLHFLALARRARTQVLNFEQAVRLLKPPGLDYRLADHLPSIVAGAAALRGLESRLEDPLSKDTLHAVLLYHLTTCRELIRGIERPYHTLYFRSGVFEPRRNERFVDCGASIGESISGLLEVTRYDIGRAWLIEPDRKNLQTLQALIDRLGRAVPGIEKRLTLVPAAVGSGQGRVAFRHVGGHGGNVVAAPAASATADVAEVEITTIDAVVDEPPTFIKMDVEGFELEALKGAATSIVEHRPRLCVSAYHRPGDLVELSRYVLGLRPDYRMHLRHHTTLRWDTCLYFH